MGQREQRLLEFGGFRLDATNRVLYRGDDVVALPPKALDTLAVLVDRRGHVVSKNELMERVWLDAYVEENNLNQAISALRKALGHGEGEAVFIETLPKRGYRFVAHVASDPTPARRTEHGEPASLEPAAGAVPLSSRFYVVRPQDEQLHEALARQDSVVLLKGARQMGKTSMLARGLQDARDSGSLVALTDFQDLGSADLSSSEALFVTLGKALAEQLELDAMPKDVWDPEDSPNTNFGRFVRREVLRRDAHVVWALDEVDRLFPYAYASEVFGLFRSWHNRRALDPTAPWHRLTLALAHATEASLFITDLNQSPFNVGTRLTLDDFTSEQIAELDRRHGSPLADPRDLIIFKSLVGGHPYLVRQGLLALAGGLSLSSLLEIAPAVEGPFGEHLGRMLFALTRDPALGDAMRAVLERRPPDVECFYRLRSAGIVLGDSVYEARPRCLLYGLFLERHLPAASESREA